MQVRKFPWISLSLLVVSFASFGWFLASATVPGVELPPGISFPAFVDEAKFRALFPKFVLLLAVGLILLLSTAFIHPISSFNRFIIRWFRSDTVAFLSVFMMAAVIAIILFWLHIFLYVLTIGATEALVRIDIQTCGFNEHHAFLILTTFSCFGLISGWIAHTAMTQII